MKKLKNTSVEAERVNSNTKDVLEVIRTQYDGLSKRQKQIADYILNHYDTAAFMTASKLGDTVSTSESTVVRLAMELGYKGYPAFQRAMQEMVRRKLRAKEQSGSAYHKIAQSEILGTVLRSDIDKISHTISNIDGDAFEVAVDTILNAKKVYVIGLRSCSPLADFLCFYLKLVCENVIQINANGSSEIFEQLIRVSDQDAVIGISFPRYSMRTLKALEFASSRQAKVITITDDVYSPVALYSSCNLITKSDMVSIVDSLVAPLSVINALIVALCMKNKEQVMGTLQMLEHVWDEFQVYSGDELNMVDEHVKFQYREEEEE